MAMRAPLPAVSRRSRVLLVVVVVLLAISLLGSSLVTVLTDVWWYDSVGFGNVYGVMLRTRVTMFVIVGLAMAAFVGFNLWLAYRLQPAYRPMSLEQQNLERYRLWLTPRLRLLISLVAAACGIVAGLIAQGQWQVWLQFANAVPFDKKDPQFNQDISFYMFQYPFFRYVLGVAFTAVVLAAVGAVFLHWLYGGVRLQGAGERMSDRARLHIWLLLAAFVLLKAWAYYLDRFGLTFSSSDVTGLDGASYADINYLLPAKNILLLISVFVAAMFVIAIWVRNALLPVVAVALLGVSAIIAGGIVPFVADQVYVRPNASALEATYIRQNINATRDAYGISGVKSTSYAPSSAAPTALLRSDTQNVPNIRLLDPSVVAQTFIQNQRGNGQYTFNEKLDVDQYKIGDKTQEYVVGVRELNLSALTGTQTNWAYQHKVLTHGYGFVAAPASKVKNGLPCYVSGFMTEQPPQCGEQPIPVSVPQIYYGELFGDNYSIVGSDSGAKNEFDHIDANGTTVNTVYKGAGGVPIGSFLRQLAYAINLHAINFILPGAVDSSSKLLYVRDPRERVQKVAPFLTVDGDPYPAVVGGRVQWIVDGYTTSSEYPNSQRETLGDATQDSLTGTGTTAQEKDQINYIRNSVKATVDAYTGEVKLYRWDNNSDALLTTWNKAFGGDLIQPKSAIPLDLAKHFRYPEDLFKVQREVLTRYHVTDPTQFFGQQNFWKVPADPTRNNNTNSGPPQPPYFLLAQLPGQNGTQFQTTSALSVAKGDSLAALFSASYDGKGNPALSVYPLPAASNALGPNQAQNNITTDSVVAKQTAQLGNTAGGSEVKYGNLLILPIGGAAGGLLYVEPVYIQPKTGNATYPTMQLVYASYNGKVVYGSTVADVIQALTGQAAPPANAPPATGNPPPTTGAGLSPELAAAVREIQDAITALHTAQKSDDFVAIGQAQARLEAAVRNFERLQGTAVTPTPSTTAGSPKAPS